MRRRQNDRTRRSQNRPFTTQDETEDDMQKTDELLFPHLERNSIRHRLSWFAAVQGLLFLSFVLLDKARNSTITSLLLCTAVAMCVPGIASAYTSRAIKNRVRLVIALCWVALGMAELIVRSL